MTRVVRFHEVGGPDVLKIEELPIADPGPGEVRLKVKAIGLNRAEIAFRSGRYLERPKLPARIGYEAAGVVTMVGEGVGALKVGDRAGVVPAFSMNDHGTYAEEVNLPERYLVKAPDDVDDLTLGAVWMQYLTAFGGLIEVGGLTSGEFVVIPAASSSVGIAAIQIASIIGAVPIAVTRTDAKRQALLELGAHHVIVSDADDVVAEVRRVTGGAGARLIFDPVAGPFAETAAKAASKGGTIIVYGGLSAQPTPFPGGLAMIKGLTFRGYTLFEITADPQALQRAKDFVLSQLAAGGIRPVIDRTFPFDAVAEAHRYMEAGDQIGKIVLTLD